MIAAALLACAVNVAPVTLEAVVTVESRGNPITLNINHLHAGQPHPADAMEAAALARRYIANGYSVDLGLMQVNSAHLAELGLTVEQALDPCTNIAAGGRILTAAYVEAIRTHGEGQDALKAALSVYNTGNEIAGQRNGYVARYYGREVVPALAGGLHTAIMTAAAAKRAETPNPYTAATEVAFTETHDARFGE